MSKLIRQNKARAAKAGWIGLGGYLFDLGYYSLNKWRISENFSNKQPLKEASKQLSKSHKANLLSRWLNNSLKRRRFKMSTTKNQRL